MASTTPLIRCTTHTARAKLLDPTCWPVNLSTDLVYPRAKLLAAGGGCESATGQTATRGHGRRSGVSGRITHPYPMHTHLRRPLTCRGSQKLAPARYRSTKNHRPLLPDGSSSIVIVPLRFDRSCGRPAARQPSCPSLKKPIPQAKKSPRKNHPPPRAAGPGIAAGSHGSTKAYATP